MAKKSLKRAVHDSEVWATPEILRPLITQSSIKLVNRAHPLSILSSLLGKGALIVVRGRRIFWPGLPDDTSHNPEMLSLLLHEALHVWQYKKGMSALSYLLRERGVYSYNLNEITDFYALGYEQQASLIEDYVRLDFGLKPRHSLTPIDLEKIERILPDFKAP